MQVMTNKRGSPLAEVLLRRRRALGITQEQLAKFAECSVPYIYLLESGKTTVRIDKLIAVLSVLGLQLRVEAGKEGLKIDEKLK